MRSLATGPVPATAAGWFRITPSPSCSATTSVGAQSLYAVAGILCNTVVDRCAHGGTVAGLICTWCQALCAWWQPQRMEGHALCAHRGTVAVHSANLIMHGVSMEVLCYYWRCAWFHDRCYSVNNCCCAARVHCCAAKCVRCRFMHCCQNALPRCRMHCHAAYELLRCPHIN